MILIAALDTSLYNCLPAGPSVFAHVGCPRAQGADPAVRAGVALETRTEKLPAVRKI